jgi:tRNA(fMet)-specific endonuclease VapC
MILDTSILIDVAEGDELVKQRIIELEERNDPIMITTSTLFELWNGIAQSTKQKKELEKIKDVIQRQIVLNLDEESAKNAGLIHGRLVKSGKRISSMDSLIAGIAQKNNKKVLTRDKHFARIKEIQVEII